jgi:hypothetical protein
MVNLIIQDMLMTERRNPAKQASLILIGSNVYTTRQNRFKKMAILKGGVDGFNYFSFILFFNQAHLWL